MMHVDEMNPLLILTHKRSRLEDEQESQQIRSDYCQIQDATKKYPTTKILISRNPPVILS